MLIIVILKDKKNMYSSLFATNVTFLPLAIIFGSAILLSIIYFIILKTKGLLTKSRVVETIIILVVLALFLWLLLYMGHIEVRSYGLLLVTGFLAAIFTGFPLLKKIGISANDFFDIIIWTFLIGLIGCRIVYFVITPDSGQLFDFNILREDGITGLSFHGGLIFGITMLITMSVIKKLPVLKVFDLIVPLAALAYGIGRIGCYLNHCCYGKDIDHHIFGALKKPFFEDIWQYPVQLYSTVMGITIFAFLYFIAFKYYDKIKSGTIVFLFFILMGIERIIMEIFRYGEAYWFDRFTPAQVISAGIIFISIIGLFIINRKKRIE